MIKDFVAVDVETTGLNPVSERIIEIGAVRYRDAKEVEIFHLLLNPGFPLPENIIELTGIGDEMLADAKTEEAAITDFLEFLNEDVILGHNILFDYGFLKSAALRQNHNFECLGIDTLTLSKKYHREAEKRSLEAMCAYYQIHNEQAHRALSDARAAASLYFKIGERFPEETLDFDPTLLVFKVKKMSPITEKQKKYLIDLIKYHKIELPENLEDMTKSEASAKIDQIISKYGKKQ